MTADSVVIEKDVPIPQRRTARAFKFNEILKSMEVGDSFVWPGTLRAANSAIHGYARYAGIKVTLRTLDDGSVRIWRIE